MFFFDLAVFVIMLYLAVSQIIKIIRVGKPSSVGLLYIAFFVVYGMPLLYRYIMPGTHKVSAFASALASTDIHIRYNFVLLTGLFILWLVSLRGPTSKIGNDFSWALPQVNLRVMSFFSGLSWVGLFLPLLIVLTLAPEKMAYMTYGAIGIRRIESEMGKFILFLVQYAVMFSLGCYFIIRTYLYYSRGPGFNFPAVFATGMMLVNCYLDGKRAILLFFLLAVGFFQMLGKGSKKILLVTVPIVFVLFFLYIYVAKDAVLVSRASYAGFLRGDLSRDHTLSFTLARTHFSYNDIVPHRGNSFWWLAVAYIPRKIYQDKPWTTSEYFTCAVYNRSLSRMLNWNYGIGYYEEFLINFGYLGLLLFIPLGLLLRWLDSLIYTKSPAYCILWIPMLYNVMFAINAALRIYVMVALPILIIYWLAMRRTSESYYYEPTIESY